MNKTILVIGSVTAEQYKPVRIESLADGNKPKIVRTTIEALFSNHEDLVHYYGSEAGVLEYWTSEFNEIYSRATTQDEHDETFRQLASKHIATFGDIEAVVMDESAWDRWGDTLEVAGEMLKERDIKRWVVINGHTEFIG